MKLPQKIIISKLPSIPNVDRVLSPLSKIGSLLSTTISKQYAKMLQARNERKKIFESYCKDKITKLKNKITVDSKHTIPPKYNDSISELYEDFLLVEVSISISEDQKSIDDYYDAFVESINNIFKEIIKDYCLENNVYVELLPMYYGDNLTINDVLTQLENMPTIYKNIIRKNLIDRISEFIESYKLYPEYNAISSLIDKCLQSICETAYSSHPSLTGKKELDQHTMGIFFEQQEEKIRVQIKEIFNQYHQTKRKIKELEQKINSIGDSQMWKKYLELAMKFTDIKSFEEIEELIKEIEKLIRKKESEIRTERIKKIKKRWINEKNPIFIHFERLLNTVDFEDENQLERILNFIENSKSHIYLRRAEAASTNDDAESYFYIDDYDENYKYIKFKQIIKLALHL